MIEQEEKAQEEKGDYFYGIVSAIVLVILSALSHFWFIAIGLCVAMLFWGAAVVLTQGMRIAVRAVALQTSPARPARYSAADSGNQVFLPGEIRQSVDG